MTTIQVGDKFQAPHNDGPMVCTVTAVDTENSQFEARWTPGAPTYWYPIRKADGWTKR